MAEVVAGTEGRPTAAALEFTTEGVFSFHLCFGPPDDEPASWSHAQAEQHTQTELPAWVVEYRDFLERLDLNQRAALEERHTKGLELAARALAECAGVFYPAKLIAYSDLDGDLDVGVQRVKRYQR